MKILVFLPLLLLGLTAAQAQTKKGVPDKAPPKMRSIPADSLAAWELRSIVRPLSLDSNQIKNCLGALKKHLGDVEQIQKTYPNDSTKGRAIREARKTLHEMLQSILTKEQYAKYRALQEENRAAFVNKQNRRKIKVTSMEVGE